MVGRGTFYITVEKPGYAPYRSEIMDLTKAEASEIVKRDIKLKPGSGTNGGAPPLAPPSQGGDNGRVGIPAVQNASQADLPKLINGNGKTNGNGNGKKNGNGKI